MFGSFLGEEVLFVVPNESVLLLGVVFVLLAEELETAVSASVDATEGHINAIAEPRVEAVHGVDQTD